MQRMAPRSSMCSYHGERGACSAKSATNRLHQVATSSTKEGRPTVRKTKQTLQKNVPLFSLGHGEPHSCFRSRSQTNHRMMEKFDGQREKERKKEREGPNDKCSARCLTPKHPGTEFRVQKPKVNSVGIVPGSRHFW